MGDIELPPPQSGVFLGRVDSSVLCGGGKMNYITIQVCFWL